MTLVEWQAMLDFVFKAVELLAIVLGGGAILIKMGRMMGEFATIGKQQAGEIAEIKQEVKQLNTLITTVAVQKAEMSSIREELSLLRRWYDELRHGRGYVRTVEE